jgi:hypothetical protein
MQETIDALDGIMAEVQRKRRPVNTTIEKGR